MKVVGCLALVALGLAPACGGETHCEPATDSSPIEGLGGVASGPDRVAVSWIDFDTHEVAGDVMYIPLAAHATVAAADGTLAPAIDLPQGHARCGVVGTTSTLWWGAHDDATAGCVSIAEERALTGTVTRADGPQPVAISDDLCDEQSVVFDAQRDLFHAFWINQAGELEMRSIRETAGVLPVLDLGPHTAVATFALADDAGAVFVLVEGDPTSLLRVDPDTGATTTVWTLADPGLFVGGAFVYAHRVIVQAVAGSTTHLLAIDPATGAETELAVDPDLAGGTGFLPTAGPLYAHSANGMFELDADLAIVARHPSPPAQAFATLGDDRVSVETVPADPDTGAPGSLTLGLAPRAADADAWRVTVASDGPLVETTSCAHPTR